LAGDWLSCKEYDEVYRAIDDFISHDVHVIPTLVRLGFHDCVGKSCDGCLNFHDSSNDGLGDTVHKLDEIWEHKFEKTLSRADFWQLASQVALVRGGLNRKCHEDKHKDCTFFDIQFWWGRKDCKTSPNHHHDDDTGDAHGDFDENYRVLNGYFDLNDKEIVAILGAHSLGGAEKKDSGFQYNWQKNELTFDNQYYQNMISLPYTHEDVSDHHHPTRLQFTFHPDHKKEEELLMLNIDMSLWKKLDALKDHHHEYTGDVKCPLEHSHKVSLVPEKKEDFVSKCEDAKTAHIVYDFAHHLDHFYDVFEDAWWKMTTNGYHHHDLHKPGHHDEHCGDCIPHGAFCVDGFEKSGKCCPGSHCVHNKCQ
jgi:catalase (peroxidase I)